MLLGIDVSECRALPGAMSLANGAQKQAASLHPLGMHILRLVREDPNAVHDRRGDRPFSVNTDVKSLPVARSGATPASQSAPAGATAQRITLYT
jgi:hypothetical protein